MTGRYQVIVSNGPEVCFQCPSVWPSDNVSYAEDSHWCDRLGDNDVRNILSTGIWHTDSIPVTMYLPMSPHLNIMVQVYMRTVR